jgi:S-(hydroxymethyl)glutathione dehydrogenase/alcohol dehydrogenase
MMDADVKLNMFLFTMLQKTLKGNIFGGGSSHVETPKLTGLYKSGLLNIDDMITRTYRLEDINQGYQDMLDGRNIRGVITFDESDW